MSAVRRACRRGLLSVSLAFSLSCLSLAARATDIVLDSAGGAGVYTTLADAFTAAKTAESPRVIVKIGTYDFADTITLDYPVTVVGEDVTNCVLTGASLYKKAFKVQDAGVVISNLTFQGIVGPTASSTEGVAITMSDGLVTDCRFLDNRIMGNYSGGAGVKMSGGTTRNCYFSGNGGDVYGLYGALMVSGGTATGCTIASVSNSGRYNSTGGGIYMSGGTVTNCVIRNCSSYFAGGICISGGTLTHCIIRNNGGTYGGIYASGRPTIKDCLIIKNSGGSAGGAYLAANSPTLRHCTIWDNTSSGATAGYTGLRMSCGTAYDNIIYGNTNGKDNWTLGSCYVTGGTFNSNVVDVVVSTGSGNQAADPLFKDAANGDFTVKLGSPAIAAGYPGGGYDLAGVEHPADKPTTCGAYEFVSAGGDLQVALLIKQNQYAEGDTVTAEVMTAGGDGSTLSYKWYVNGSSEVCSTDAKLVIENCPAAKLSIRVEVSQGGGTPVSDTKADAITVYPRQVYVNESNDNPVWPYADAKSAATSLDTAYAALWQDSTHTAIVDIAAGTYPIAGAFTLSNPIVIRGQGRGVTTLDASALTGGTAFYLKVKDAVISNLTLNVGSSASSSDKIYGKGINMSNGLVSNCRICNSGLYGYNSCGGPIYMTGGRVEHCQIDTCSGGGSTGSSSGSIYASGGTLTNCDIFACSSSSSGGAITISGATVVRTRIHNNSGAATSAAVYLTSGSLVNCLVYSNKNTSSTCAAGVYAKGGTVKYCTITDNATSSDPDGRSGVQVDGAATIVNNVIWGNGPSGSTKGSLAFTGSGYVFKGNVTDTDTKIETNVAGDPKFIDAVSTNYHIKSASAAKGLAVVSYRVASDYDGVERAEDQHCSGAYEYVKGEGKLTADVTLSTPTQVKVGTEITFTAAVENAEDESALTYAWTLNGESFGTTKSVTTSSLATGKYTVGLSVTEGETTVAAKPVEFAVKPVRVYAGPLRDNVTPTYPYDAPNIAATNINEAVAALWQAADSTGVVEIAEGQVQMTDGITLRTPVMIIGAGRDRTVLTGTSSIRLFNLTDPDAFISDLCVSNFSFYGGSANAQGAFMMSTGVVRRVRVYNVSTPNEHADSHRNDGLGLYMTGGRFEDSVIESCTQSGYYARGAGIYMQGGLVERCEIRNCTGSRSAAGGAFVGAGIVRNCLFVGCDAGRSEWKYSAKVIDASVWAVGESYYGGTGKIINCTVAGSSATYSSSVPAVAIYNSSKLINSIVWNGCSTPDVSGTAANIVNCCYKDATGSGNIAEDPKFRSATRGDYRIRIGSPCIDAGDWTQLGDSKESVKDATDLRGISRLFGENVDMGCYENPKTGLTFIVR